MLVNQGKGPRSFLGISYLHQEQLKTCEQLTVAYHADAFEVNLLGSGASMMILNSIRPLEDNKMISHSAICH